MLLYCQLNDRAYNGYYKFKNVNAENIISRYDILQYGSMCLIIVAGLLILVFTMRENIYTKFITELLLIITIKRAHSLL